jgi:hypothetical protein
VAELALTRLSTGAWTQPGERAVAEARIWLSQPDVDGCMELCCLSGDDGEDRTLWIALQRIGYRHIFDELDGQKNSSAIPNMLRHKLSAAFAAPILASLRQACALLHLMGEQGALLERMPAQHTGQRLLNSASRLSSLLEQCDALNTLGYLWFVLMQERGGSLASLCNALRPFGEEYNPGKAL